MGIDDQPDPPAEKASAQDQSRHTGDRTSLAGLIAEVTHDAIIAIDPAGIVVEWNQGAADLTVIPRDESLGADARQLLRQLGAAVPERQILRTLARGGMWTGELEITRSDGLRLRCRGRIAGVMESGRWTGGVVGAFQDVKSDQSALLAQDELRPMVDRISDGFMALNQEWRVRYMNPAGMKILRLSAPAGKLLTKLFPLPDAREFFDHYEAAMRHQEPRHFEACYDAFGRWYEVHAYPSREGVTVYFRDITRRRISQQRRRISQQLLRESNERFELAARATRDVMFDWDIRSGSVWRSDAVENLLGYEAGEISSRPDAWFEHVHPDDVQSLRETRKAFVTSGGDLMSQEYRLRRKDGTLASVLSRAVAVRDDAGRAVRVIGAVTDLSRQKEIERELAESRSRLIALSRSLIAAQESERKRLARDLHDQLGQTLTVLKYAVRKQDDGSPERAETLGRMIDDMIDDVRRMARSLRPPLLDELGLVAALARELREFSASTGLSATVSSEPEFLDLEPDLSITLFRIAQEALTNVARHARAMSVRVRLEGKGDEIMMCIYDDGRGISATEAQCSRSLGITGMRERARLLGGDLEIRRRSEGGTMVRLTVTSPTKGHAD